MYSKRPLQLMFSMMMTVFLLVGCGSTDTKIGSVEKSEWAGSSGTAIIAIGGEPDVTAIFFDRDELAREFTVRDGAVVPFTTALWVKIRWDNERWVVVSTVKSPVKHGTLKRGEGRVDDIQVAVYDGDDWVSAYEELRQSVALPSVDYGVIVPDGRVAAVEIGSAEYETPDFVIPVSLKIRFDSEAAEALRNATARCEPRCLLVLLLGDEILWFGVAQERIGSEAVVLSGLPEAHAWWIYQRIGGQ